MAWFAGVLFCLSRRYIRSLGVLDKSVEVLGWDRPRPYTELSLDRTLEFWELSSLDDCGMSGKITERIQSPPDGGGDAAGLCSMCNCCPASRLRTDFIRVVGVWQTPLTAVIQEAGETQWQLSQTAGEAPGAAAAGMADGASSIWGLFSGNSVQSCCPWHLLLGWANQVSVWRGFIFR